MTSEETLQEFQCALSTDYKHFLIDPICLTNCGHSVCKSCLQDGKISSIKCFMCGMISELDFSKIQVAKGFKQALKFFLDQIFKRIENDFSSKLGKLKSNQIHSNNSILATCHTMN